MWFLAFAFTLSSFASTFTFVAAHEENGFCSLQQQLCSNSGNDFESQITNSLDNWDQCSGLFCFASQIDRDLESWYKSGISRKLIDEAKDFGVHYQLIDGKWYRDSHCLFPSRCEGIEYFLNRLLDHPSVNPETQLNNTELVINVRDWAQVFESRHTSTPPPVFSFSKGSHYLDILYPAWAFWAGGPAISTFPTGIGKWDQLTKKIIGSQGVWQDKKSFVFFRGSRTSEERDALILLSRKHPDVLDAQYTKNQAWRSKKDTLGHDPAPIVSFEEHCKYKYLINLRGVAASFRLKHLFLCNSVVLNVESDMVEFFYHALRPWVHYVPIRPDLGDLLDKVAFLRQNDHIAKQIANRGFNFIKDNLTNDQVTAYWRHLLTSYSRLLKYKVKPEKGLVNI